MTALTVKMNVLVIVMLMSVMAVTQFIAYPITTILYNMYQMVLTEKGECPEYARLVN